MARQAVVTGGTGAVGAAVVRACVEAGFDVHSVQRRDAPAAAGVTVHRADLADDAQLGALAGELGALEDLALLVHAAGVFVRGEDDAGIVRRVNVEAPGRLTRGLLPALRAAKADVVFVNSSVAARPPAGEDGAYAASKRELRALADTLRAEENEYGLRVLSVYLGRTAGPLQERLHADEGKAYDEGRLLQPGDVARTIIDAVTLPPTAEVTDLHIRPRRKPAA
jgi:NADP-dependent 3-hydroxy acid dehydrogenase YdfG